MTHQQQQIKAQRKHKSARYKPRRRKWMVLILFLLFLGVKRLVKGATYTNLLRYTYSTSITLQCSSASHFTFYSTFFQKMSASPTIYTFNLDGTKVGSAPTYIPDDTTPTPVDQYGMYEIGNDCYMHTNQDDRDTATFILVIENSGDATNKCKLTRIITKGPITPCVSDPKEQDLFGGPLELVLSDNAAGTAAAFLKVKADKHSYHRTDKLYGSVISLDDPTFSLPASVDNQFVEMLVLEFVDTVISYLLSGMIDYLVFDNINQRLTDNPFAVEVKPADVAKRLIHDDLPGYYLDVYNGDPNTDDSSKVLAKVMTTRGQFTIQTELYIQKPDQIAVGETHSIEIKSRYFKFVSTDPALNRDLQYKIEVTRTATLLQFRVKRGAGEVAVPALNIDKSYAGGTDYISFNFDIGKGILYYININDGRSKTYETLHVYSVGQPIQQASATVEANEDVATILSAKFTENTYSSTIYTTVRYLPHTGVTTNKAGFRVMRLRPISGVVTPYLVATMNPGSYKARCFNRLPKSQRCLAMAHLSDPSETQALDYIKYHNQGSTATGTLATVCKTISTYNRCYNGKPGYIVNLEVGAQLPLPADGLMSLADYDAFPDQSVKDLLVEVTSNTGTRYLITCPPSCKKIS